MNEMGMSVIAWGFSYQVKDKPSASQVSSKATKFYCDFKFRSATFNEGYVGRDIIVGMTKTPGYEILNSLKRVYFYLVRGKRYQNGFRISSSSQQTIGD